jgi:YbbR domain-containing protein
MKRIFESGPSLKIASVVIAVALWFFVNSRGVSELTISVPLEIKNLSEGYEIVTQKIKEVNVGLKGHERLIKGIRIQDIRVYLDMSKMKDGWGVYYINKENIKVPSSIEVTKIDPSVVKIKAEKTVEKKVKVKANVQGALKEGYKIVSVIVEPKKVSIEGAKSIAGKFKDVSTEMIDVTGKVESFEQKVKVLTNGKNVRLTEDEVAVKVKISKAKK